MPRESVTAACYATAVRKASRRISALYDEALAPVGLRSTQYAVLQELAAGGPFTLNELAEVLVLDRSGLGHSLRPLERDGLVSMEPNPDDRRSMNITLTELGARRYEQAFVLWQGTQENVRATLGVVVAEELRRALNAVAAQSLTTTNPG